jgi:hypothetical protein
MVTEKVLGGELLGESSVATHITTVVPYGSNSPLE